MLKSSSKSISEILGRSTVHPFPARMAPGIALQALGESKQTLTVLDPMAGSGTVLAVASEHGHQAIGLDLDPLAALMAKVWTRPINPEKVLAKATEVLNCARFVFKHMRLRKAYPANSDSETQKFIRYWYDNYSRRQLTALANSIQCIRDRAVRDVLWCAFSKLIITKQAGASLAMDLSHSRPHKVFSKAPVKPFHAYLAAVKTVVANCPIINNRQNKPIVKMNVGDARKLNIADNSIDIVLTSPPYLNAIDYIRCSKFSLVWMGFSIRALRKIRSTSVGTESSLKKALNSESVQNIITKLQLMPSLSNRNYAILARYIWDMEKALKETSRVLKNGGKAVYVVGDSTIRGTFIQNSSVIAILAEEQGFELIRRVSRALPDNRRYMPPPKGKGTHMNMRMRHEVVLEFKKSLKLNRVDKEG